MNKKYPNKIREIRKRSGMTLEAVAEILDCSHTTLSRIESGTTNVPIGRFMELARLFDVPLTTLIEDSFRKTPVIGEVIDGDVQFVTPQRFVDIPIQFGEVGVLVLADTSFYPRYDKGDLIAYGSKSDDFTDVLHNEIVIFLEDRRTLLRRIASVAGHVMSVFSHNIPHETVAVREFAPLIDWISRS